MHSCLLFHMPAGQVRLDSGLACLLLLQQRRTSGSAALLATSEAVCLPRRSRCMRLHILQRAAFRRAYFAVQDGVINRDEFNYAMFKTLNQSNIFVEKVRQCSA